MRNLESKLQISCVRWFRHQYPAELLFSVPNGGIRNKITGLILKEEGSLSGVSDLILFAKRGGYGALCIEMKYGKNHQQETQKHFQIQVETKGYKYVICRSLEEFMVEVTNYLNLR